MMALGADQKGFEVTGRIPAGIDLDFLVDVAHRPQAEIQRTCSHRYQAFTSLLRGAARSKPWNGGLGSAGAVMTSLYWNGSAFAQVNRTAAEKQAALLRLEAAFMGVDAIPSHKHRGLMLSLIHI